MDTLNSFQPFFDKGDNLCDFLFAFLHQAPSEAESAIRKELAHSIKNEFTPRGSKFFLYRVDPFTERNKNKFENCVP